MNPLKKKKKGDLRDRVCVAAATLLTVIALGFAYEGYRESGLTHPFGRAADDVTISLTTGSDTVNVRQLFAVDVYMDTGSSEISAVDIDLVLSDNVKLIDIVPKKLTVDQSFTTFAPIDEDGNFDEERAIFNGEFGATTYDVTSHSFDYGISGSEIFIARLWFRAVVEGEVTINLNFTQSDTTDTNAIVVELPSSSEPLISVGSAIAVTAVKGDCVPVCDNRECGPDGCGGVCGECDSGYHCKLHTCIPDPTPQEEEEQGEKERTLFEETEE